MSSAAAALGSSSATCKVADILEEVANERR